MMNHFVASLDCQEDAAIFAYTPCQRLTKSPNQTNDFHSPSLGDCEVGEMLQWVPAKIHEGIKTLGQMEVIAIIKL